ncbi:DUF4159 domain-containing protein [Candidatus Desantisbacteria bacterium]|nr:DUF4159 domain-containing protein [Candidatus Desantisbacteria bacterium]
MMILRNLLSIVKGLLVSVIFFGMVVTANASMIYSDNDYSCGWENYASDITNTNSFEIAVNLAVFAGGRNNISIAQLNYGGGGDWNTDYPTDLYNIKTKINAQLPLANVTINDLPAGADLATADLSVYDLLIMVGHNDFIIGSDGQARLKCYLDAGGVLFVDDCAGSDSVSGFENGFNNLIYGMYGITNASLVNLPVTHQIYNSYYILNGNDFSWTYAGNGTEWAQRPLRGYENHPEENNPTVPEPSTFILFGAAITGLGFMRKKFKE